MTQSADATAREQVYLSLAPLFLEAAKGNREDARAAAQAMGDGHNPRSRKTSSSPRR